MTHDLSKVDAPARLLAAAVRRCPTSRQDWGEAMEGELEALAGRAERWRFALGAARVATFPPRPGRPSGPVALSASLALLGTGWALAEGKSPMLVFALTFAATIAVILGWRLARSRRLIGSPPSPAAAVVLASGAVACLAATVTVLATHPSGQHVVHPAAGDGRQAVFLVPLAIMLVAYLSFGLNPPRTLVASRVARLTGLGAGVVFGVAYLLASSVSYTGGWIVYFFAPMLLPFACAAVSAWADRSWRSGLHAAVWAGLATALWAFVAPLLALLGPFQRAASMRDDFDGTAPYDTALWFSSVLGQHLTIGTAGLVLFPLVALLFGLAGAGIGRGGRAILATTSP